jgi:outer membrane murein-binding lipoprotein Lpp
MADQVHRSVRRFAVGAVAVLALGLALPACQSGSDEQQQQIDELTAQVDDLNAQVDDLSSQVDDLTTQLADETERADTAEANLADTQAQLDDASAQLSQAQAELLDAQAQLADVGELVLKDGDYVGQVLAAKATPYRVILFDAAGLWRVAQVADDATITSGGEDLTLAQLGKLLKSTNPDDIKLVNGNYKVKVKGGVATSIRKSSG